MAVSKASANAITPAAKGAIAIGSGTNAAGVLAAGTNNYVLTADSAETLGVKWAAAAGGGKVLQVVQAQTSTSASNSTSTYADTNLTATITPSATTSKILIFVNQCVSKSNANAGNSLALRLLRGATTIQDPIATLGIYTGTALGLIGLTSVTYYLDSPSTTSATTYKTQFMNPNNTASVTCQNGGDSTSSIVLMEIGA